MIHREIQSQNPDWRGGNARVVQRLFLLGIGSNPIHACFFNLVHVPLSTEMNAQIFEATDLELPGCWTAYAIDRNKGSLGEQTLYAIPHMRQRSVRGSHQSRERTANVGVCWQKGLQKVYMRFTQTPLLLRVQNRPEAELNVFDHLRAYLYPKMWCGTRKVAYFVASSAWERQQQPSKCTYKEQRVT